MDDLKHKLDIQIDISKLNRRNLEALDSRLTILEQRVCKVEKSTIVGIVDLIKSLFRRTNAGIQKINWT